ncbi:hypothetical protein HZH68_016620 [Vespula germanica]|uniref:Phenoloxidase-activating factor 2 n=1 Tax=Vespula germanica TaxID=30212 RepID=A0A834J0T9_VESGE|nr:hypothetical protein HZH68_016620 [Vespula germanica]
MYPPNGTFICNRNGEKACFINAFRSLCLDVNEVTHDGRVVTTRHTLEGGDGGGGGGGGGEGGEGEVAYTCPICGATGDTAHTVSHCPMRSKNSASYQSKPSIETISTTNDPKLQRSSIDRSRIVGLIVPSFFHLHKFKLEKLEKITSTPPTTDCICVPYYLCDPNTTVIIDGTGNIDIRYRRCTGDLEVCCKLPNVTAAPIVTPTPATTMTTKPPSTAPPTTPTTLPPTTLPTTTPSPTTPPTTVTTMQPTAPIIFPTGYPILPTGIPGINCICVWSWQCNPQDVVIIGTSGEGIIIPRQQTSLCPGVGQVCCRLTSNVIPTIITPTVQPQTAQICVICGNTLQCTNGANIVIPSGSGPITNVDTTVIINGLGQMKFPGTSNACYCVKSWLCTQGNVVNLDGAGIIDPRFTICTSADEVCCRPAGIIASNQVYSDFSAGPRDLVINNPIDPLDIQVVCGIRGTANAPATPYPTSSGKTYFAEFPWMVSLFAKQPDGKYLYRCGASMINNGAVLTAAHCVTNQENGALVARFGQWNVKNNSEPIQEAGIKAIIPHPLYYSAGLFHDIAILILNSTVNYATNIIPICLPQQGMIFSSGTRCFGTGWGSSAFGSSGEYQAELRKVDLPIVERSDCQNRLRTTNLGQSFLLHGSFICAGGELNKDTCRGDGGGPLVCPTATGQFIQAGIVSWGIGCGESNIPAVYTSVSQHKQWIDQQLANYGVQY